MSQMFYVLYRRIQSSSTFYPRCKLASEHPSYDVFPSNDGLEHLPLLFYNQVANLIGSRTQEGVVCDRMSHPQVSLTGLIAGEKILRTALLSSYY